MKYFIVKTLLVDFPINLSDPINIELPDNAVPISIEVWPRRLILHHLIPCDNEGNIIDEKILPSDYEAAWKELCKCFGERMQQEEIDLMDSVMKGILVEKEEKQKEG